MGWACHDDNDNSGVAGGLSVVGGVGRLFVCRIGPWVRMATTMYA